MKRISSYATVMGVLAALGALILMPRQCRAHKVMMYASADFWRRKTKQVR